MIRYEIVRVSTDEVLPVRHQVLWPNRPISFCEVEEDDQAKHFGVKVDGRLVCVVSLYIKGGAARLRKFATLPEFQGRGIGSQMLEALMDRVRTDGVHYLWLDARESAMDFYSRFGFKAEGERFHKGDIAYFRMSQQLDA